MTKYLLLVACLSSTAFGQERNAVRTTRAARPMRTTRTAPPASEGTSTKSARGEGTDCDGGCSLRVWNPHEDAVETTKR